MLNQQIKWLFICAIQQCRFKELLDRAKPKCKHEGDTAVPYNDDMFVTHWYAKVGENL